MPTERPNISEDLLMPILSSDAKNLIRAIKVFGNGFNMTQKVITFQSGPQCDFLSSKSDLCIFGGGAGGGKTYALLLECLRHIYNPKFNCIIFRRNSTMIRNPGGLWDISLEMFSQFGGIPRQAYLDWTFPSGAVIKFAHLEHSNTVLAYQGAQIPLIMWDEICHFEENQFWYLMSRLRSLSGIPGYVRATCNPDPDSFIYKLISYWIGSNGYPIKERSGVLRWFIRINDEMKWGDSKQELINLYGDEQTPKSITFIPSLVTDNKILMEKDPTYISNLQALSLVDRKRLLEGNWLIRPTAGTVFKKEWFEIVDSVPAAVKSVRYYDRASSVPSQNNPDPDSTVGLKVIRDAQGIFYVVDCIRMQESTHKVETTIKNTASQDGLTTAQWLEVDPGQAGVFEKNYYVKLLAGYDVHFNRPTKNKQERAKVASAQAEPGNIKILRAPWNETFLNELQAFPEGKHDDQVDCLSGSITVLTQTGVGDFTNEMAESEEKPIAIDESFDSEW